MFLYIFPIICACIIVATSFGSRQILPLTIDGITNDRALDYITLSFAFAVGQVIWGFANYIGGMVADKFGDEKALFLGIILSALGCYLIQYCDSTIEIVIAVGLLSAGGAGIAGLAVAMSAVNKKVPEKKAGLAFGVLNAGGSLGQTFLAPIGVIIIINYGWIFALNCLSLLLLLTLPLTYFLRDHRVINKSLLDYKKINILGMIKLAFQTPSYNFLALGFFTCGFHVAFISTHMPGVIAYCGLPTSLSGWSLAFIGFFNIIGSLFAGWYISKRSKKLFLSSIYLSRALIVLVFLILPKTEVTFLIFSALLGVTYLSTVPPTAALVSKMFGPSCMGTLFGLALFSHQIGAFFGAYLGGYFFTITGEYTFVWLIDIILAIFAAIIHLPIKEKLVTTSTI